MVTIYFSISLFRDSFSPSSMTLKIWRVVVSMVNVIHSVYVGGGEAGGWRVNRRSPFCSSLGKCFISGIAERVLKMKVLCGQSGVPRAPASFIMERKWHLNPPYSTQLSAYPSPQTLRAEQLSPSCLEAKLYYFFPKTKC